MPLRSAFSHRALVALTALALAASAIPAPSSHSSSQLPTAVAAHVGRGVGQRIACLGCVAGFLALSAGGSVAGVAMAVAFQPEIAAGCGFACAIGWR